MVLFPYSDTHRYDMAVNEKVITPHISAQTNEVVTNMAPNKYYPYPFLNPATHQMGNPKYLPDSNLPYASHLNSTEPFYRSLPMKEQNLWWEETRMHDPLKRKFDDHDERYMPVNSFCRVPKGTGKWPKLKRVSSEPNYDMYDSTESCLSQEGRKIRREQLRAERGRQLLMRADITNMDPMASPKVEALLKNARMGRSTSPGVGEIFVATSLLHHQKSRCRELFPNKPIQTLVK